VIVITSIKDIIGMETLQSLGIKHVIPKPIKKEELKETIESLWI